jgi:predicted lipid-binding transport protein (Tim44 family)
MSLDIIIYAVIAIIILARLWTVLGNRNENDRERPNPFSTPPVPPAGTEDEKFATSATRPQIPGLLRPVQAAPASLAGGLEQIKALDPSFDEKQFLQGARTAFASIVEAFSKGDLAPCASFLGPDVTTRFHAAIEARREAGQVMETKIQRVKDAETAAAKTDGTRAIITVRFVSDQENVLRDSFGKVIGGAEGKAGEVVDLWTFARDTKSPDPNWQLVETRS